MKRKLIKQVEYWVADCNDSKYDSFNTLLKAKMMARDMNDEMGVYNKPYRVAKMICKEQRTKCSK